MLHTGRGRHSFRWVDGWSKLPSIESARAGWAHHGLAITEKGQVLAFHQGESRVLVLDMEGTSLRSWRCSLTEGHGLTLVKEGRAERLWLADLPPGTGLVSLVRLAKVRWWIEQGYQQLKDELGLDHYEGRSWQGWHHHDHAGLRISGPGSPVP